MHVLLESTLAFVALGALLVTAAAILFVQTRSRLAFALLLVAVLLAIGGVALERLWVTPREQATRAVGELFDAIRANDLPAVLRLLDPQADQMRADAEVLMPMFVIESAGAGGGLEIELPADPSADGAIAKATLKPLIRVQHTKTGMTGAYFDGLELDLVRRGDRWLFLAYEPAQDWRGLAARAGR